MASESCPYCGTVLTTSLKFCMKCRRSITENSINQAGKNAEEDEGSHSGKFRLSRKSSYDGVRQTRRFFLTITTLLVIFFGYFFTMKFVIHQQIPYEHEATALIDDMAKRIQSQSLRLSVQQPAAQQLNNPAEAAQQQSQPK